MIIGTVNLKSKPDESVLEPEIQTDDNKFFGVIETDTEEV